MERTVGTISRGIRAPIIREGDDLVSIVTQSVLNAATAEGFSLRDRDVVAVTEAVVARCQGNYATTEQIAGDVRSKYPSGTVGVLFPILSRNRFAVCLEGIARGSRHVVLQLCLPSDEVGNHLVLQEDLDRQGINPYTDLLTLERFRELFSNYLHPFTGVDYVAYYEQIIKDSGAEATIIFSNDPTDILKYTPDVLCCDVHTRARTKRVLTEAGAATVYGLDDILAAPVDGSGYNEVYGLLGSNRATEHSLKLFPRDAMPFVLELQRRLHEATGKHVEVMVYGDGAFKDPIGKIWELADPVVSPAYTPGLEGTPHELKLKYLADNQFAHLRGEELTKAVSDHIRQGSKDENQGLGTTPRRLTDLLGSLADLTSGSGDKGTPIVLIQGYFDNYTVQ